MPDMEAVPVCTARIVCPRGCAELVLRTEDGLFHHQEALRTAAFEHGDVVEIRLLRREGDYLPPLVLPPQLGRAYGSPLPYSYAPESEAPETLRDRDREWSVEPDLAPAE